MAGRGWIFLTGKISGSAWSANIGWIALETPFSTLATRLACPDADGDGIADAWERMHFGNLTGASAASNSDGDRFTDAAEFAAGTDPLNAASSLRIVAQDCSSDLTTGKLEFTSVTNRLYRIEYAPDLAGTWTNSTSGTIAPDTGATTSARIAFPGGDRRFFRIVAMKPLQP